MGPHKTSCRKTGATFSIEQDDLKFLERVSPTIGGNLYLVPPPTLQPEVRAMRRLAWRNASQLYRRRCDRTGQSIISNYPADAPYPVYATKEWWGDGWDQLDSGLKFDFSRPFFDQFRDLQLQAPRPALMNSDPENSDYCNYAGDNKNCYMANNGSWYSENCLFGESYLRTKDSADCSYLYKCELCYEVVGGECLYECAFVVDCAHCVGCFFSFNLRSCTNCILCGNLSGKSDYLFNKPATKAEIAAVREKMKTQAGRDELLHRFLRLREESLHPAVHELNCEDSTGDYIHDCKNVHYAFIVGNVRDGKYLIHTDEAEDMWDCSLAGYGKSELYYEAVSSGDAGYRALFCSGSWRSSDVMYCDTVMSCNNCFGCVGLKRAEYCVLNRRFKQDEYEKLVGRIIEHMHKTGEWGEFFPETLAPHAYNESAANDFFPLTDREALSLGYRWCTEPAAEGRSSSSLPESIDGASAQICEKLFSCKETNKPYKIIAPELSLLQKLGIAPPRLAPETRRRRRNKFRNAPRFWTRRCIIRGEELTTTIPPDGPKQVCCQSCYRELVYG